MAFESAQALGDLCLCVLQGEGCCPTAGCCLPALGLPATLRKGIGKQLALPGPGHPRRKVAGREGNETGKGTVGGGHGKHPLEQRGCRPFLWG